MSPCPFIGSDDGVTSFARKHMTKMTEKIFSNKIKFNEPVLKSEIPE